MTKNITGDRPNYAAYRVFETLKFLINQPANVDEIAKYLENLNNTNDRFLSKSVIYKYLATLKFAGIQLKRKNFKYVVEKLHFKIKIAEEEIKAIKILKNLLNHSPEENISKNLKKFFYIAKMIFSINYEELEESEIINYKEPETPSEILLKDLRYYEDICNKSQRLKITATNLLKEDVTYICEPIETKFEKDNIYLLVYNLKPNQFIEINIKQIKDLSILPQKSIGIYSSNTTIFKLKDELAKRYTLRNNEKSFGFDNEGNLTIANQCEPKNILHMRLMRYGELCEIISPNSERELMKKIINMALKNN